MTKSRRRPARPSAAPAPKIVAEPETVILEAVPAPEHANDPHGTVAMLLMVLCMLLLMFLVIAIAQSA